MKKIIKSISLALCCLSIQQIVAQNYPVNKINNSGINLSPSVPTNERYVIGVNANSTEFPTGSNVGPTPNITSFHNSPLSWRSNAIVKSQQFWQGANLETKINEAISLGYRNIFIQRGQYVISNPIVINVDNVTIEGESNLTIIKPENNSANGLFPAANSIFEITGKNNVIINLSIDCSAYTPTYSQSITGTSGITAAIELKSGAENNTFREISIENISSTPANITFSKGAIYLNNQTGFIHNNLFDNIFMKQVNIGVVLNSVNLGDGIRHNSFSNIKMDRARIHNVEFIGVKENNTDPETVETNGFKPFRNSFDNFSIQPFASQSNVLKNVEGSRNVFNGFKIADWTTQGQVVNIKSTAWATVITNFEMGNNKVHNSVNDIDDQGKLTQLLFNERAGVMYSQLGFDGFNNGSNNKSLTAVKGGLMLSAEQGGVNNYFTPTAAAGKVLTCLDTEGRATWQTLGSLAWDHIAVKNIKMDGFALTNHSNAEPNTNTDAGLRLDDNGNVRIGTTAPATTNPAKLQVDGRVFIGTPNDATNNYDANYKLLVNGKVLVRNEVYVKQGGITWPDYVFAKDYKLMPLQQVEQHIQEKGYLPNMPSAAEVEKEGIAVGNIIKLQQEKIEELTLYLIEMKKNEFMA